MDFNIGKIGQHAYGAQGHGVSTPAFKAQPLKQSPQKAQEGLVARLGNINGELTPSLKGGATGNKLDFFA